MPTTKAKRAERPRAAGDGLTDRAQMGGHLAAMPRHPDVVPGQHDDGDAENGRVEKLLPSPADRVRDRAGEGREKGRAANPRCNP